MNSKSIVLRLSGGLGNQLFQYSAFKELCQMNLNYSKFIFTKHLKNYKTKREFMLKDIIDNDEIIDFKLPYYYEFILKLRINKLINFFKWSINKNSFDNRLKNNLLVIDDYFQDVSLIKSGINQVLSKLQKLLNINEKINKIFYKIDTEFDDIICLHFRAGDYLLNENEFYIQTENYYKKCIKEISFSNPTLVIFGNNYLLNKFHNKKVIISNEYKLNDFE